MTLTPLLLFWILMLLMEDRDERRKKDAPPPPSPPTAPRWPGARPGESRDAYLRRTVVERAEAGIPRTKRWWQR